MSEVPVPRPIAPEILSTQRWMEEFVAGKGICPPLVKVMQRYRDEESGMVDWDRLSEKIEISSYHHLDPSNPHLLTLASLSYLRFITDAANGTAPLSTVVILPDFSTNAAYDEFLAAMKWRSVAMLSATPETRRTAISLFLKASEQRGTRRQAEAVLRREGSPAEAFVIGNLVDQAYRPIPFYGKELSSDDLIGFSEERGSIERQKFLSRGPYYMFQVVNMVDGFDLSRNLDRPRLYRRNNAMAFQTDARELNTEMGQFRDSVGKLTRT